MFWVFTTDVFCAVTQWPFTLLACATQVAGDVLCLHAKMENKPPPPRYWQPNHAPGEPGYAAHSRRHSRRITAAVSDRPWQAGGGDVDAAEGG